MYINTSVRPLSREELHIRRLVLRDAIICIGWIKLGEYNHDTLVCLSIDAEEGSEAEKRRNFNQWNCTKCQWRQWTGSLRARTFDTYVLINRDQLSIFCYTGLYFLVKIYSEGTWSNVIQYMILAIIPIQILSAILLFLGAVEVKPFALKVALWLSLFMALYTTILGAIGAVYFIRYGTHCIHFIIAAIFFFLSFSVCSVFCHDSIVIYTFIKLIECPPPLPAEPETSLPIISYPPDECPKCNDEYCDWSCC